MAEHAHRPTFWGFLHPAKRLDAGKLICTFRCRGCPLKLRLADSQSRLYEFVRAVPMAVLAVFLVLDRTRLRLLPEGLPAVAVLGLAYLLLVLAAWALFYAFARFVPAPEEEQDRPKYDA